MIHNVNIYAGSAYMEPLGYDSIKVSLNDIDLDDLIHEVTPEELLKCMDTETIELYLNERKAEEAEDEADD